jgi:3-oxoacyl-[acyl-carrier protein] reductase
MNLELTGKTAVVTGASRGIGLSVARLLSQEGCHVVLNARDEKGLTRAAQEIEGPVSLVAGDVTAAGVAEKIVAAAHNVASRLDILVCNVGSGRSAPPGEENSDDWEEMLSLNLHATTKMVGASEDALSAFDGAIVCISSICGLEVLGAPVPYAAAKAALNAWVKNAARPLARRGIRVNAVAPGNILFDGSVWERKMASDNDAVQAMLRRDVALARLGQPEEIANAVAFLASPRSAFTTGSILVVDGGQTRS